jgi:hypothetical protein
LSEPVEQVERVEVTEDKGVLLWVRNRPHPLKAFPFANVIDLLDILKAPISSVLDSTLAKQAGVLRKYLPPKKLSVGGNQAEFDLDPFDRGLREAVEEVARACRSSDGGKILADRLESGRDILLTLLYYDTSYRWLAQMLAYVWVRNLLEKHGAPEDLKRRVLEDVIDRDDAYWIRMKKLWNADLILKGGNKDGEGQL